MPLIHGYRGEACAVERAVTCEATESDGNCILKLHRESIQDGATLSLNINGDCFPITRDYDKLYYQRGDELVEYQCEKSPETFYDVLKCIVPGLPAPRE